MSDQAPERLHDDGEPPLQHVDLPRVTQIERRRDTELGQCLLRRSSRVREVPASLGTRGPAGGFRYVGADGERRAHQLIGPGRGARSGQRAAQSGRLHGDLQRELVNL